MKNDELKDFVDRNRAAFDELEPPVGMLSKIKAGLPAQPKQPQIVPHYQWRMWVAAASVVLALGIGYYFYPAQSPTQLAKQPTRKIEDKPNTTPTTISVEPQRYTASIEKSRHPHPVKAFRKPKSFAPKLQLMDSTSASNRLAAVIAIQQSNQISYNTINDLIKTIDNDDNTNVRLAALNILKKYAADSYVNAQLVKSLPKQTDPSMQLEMVTLLGHFNNPQLGETLFALANDPNTIDAVKNEAYMQLLNLNKF